MNPFETYLQQFGQSPVKLQHQTSFQPSQRIQDTSNYYQQIQQPQFYHELGKQPVVYYQNLIPDPQPKPAFQQLFSPSRRFNSLNLQSVPNQFVPQQFVPFQLVPQPVEPETYNAPDETVGFHRGHIETNPLTSQVQTYTSFKVSL